MAPSTVTMCSDVTPARVFPAETVVLDPQRPGQIQDRAQKPGCSSSLNRKLTAFLLSTRLRL